MSSDRVLIDRYSETSRERKKERVLLEWIVEIFRLEFLRVTFVAKRSFFDAVLKKRNV